MTEDAAKADEWIWTANRDVTVHYGFADPSNFMGVKGYEAYADREATATAVLAAAVTGEHEAGRFQDARLSRVEPDDRNAGGGLQAAQGRPEGLLVLAR